MPPPTETSILTSFLIPPSSLPEVISLQRFTDLFPKSNRTHPDIPVLYRELQHQRALVVDQIKEDIKAEAKRGERSRREVVRARRRAEAEELVGISGAIQGDHGREVQMETAILGGTGSFPARNSHTLATILAEMEEACVDVEAEIAAIEAESETILADVKVTIGDLSDLRYGKFSRPSDGVESLGQEIRDGLGRLETGCERIK